MGFVAALLLDPFDIFNRFINPVLPDSIRRTIPLDLPSELFPWALNVLLLIAGLLTYHELRKDNFLVQSRAPTRLIKQTSIDKLAELRGRFEPKSGESINLRSG